MPLPVPPFKWARARPVRLWPTEIRDQRLAQNSIERAGHSTRIRDLKESYGRAICGLASLDLSANDASDTTANQFAVTLEPWATWKFLSSQRGPDRRCGSTIDWRIY